DQHCKDRGNCNAKQWGHVGAFENRAILAWLRWDSTVVMLRRAGGFGGIVSKSSCGDCAAPEALDASYDHPGTLIY
ncbi:hypothetical protein NL487_30620, partial [Klebsiella pneumoniae]|nr:hypothetical protein [Klebsiella pneumoniae]